MNEARRDDDPTVLAATSADVRAAEWLQKQRFWAWSDEDQTALDAWLAESPAHQVAYWRLDAAWDRTQRLVALRPAVVKSSESIRGKILWPLFASLAATAAIAVLVSAGAYFFHGHPSAQIFSTPVGGREIVTLANGTQIELNTDTELRASAQGGVTTVAMVRGEAYFQVKHDPAHPFVVTAENGRVLDLGTKFLVRKDTKGLEVALLEGRVRFEPTNGDESEKPAVLTTGDVVLATQTSMSVTQKSAAELARELSWRRGLLVFKRATVAAATEEFNRYNSQKLIVADTQTGALIFSSVFPINGTEEFVRLAQKTLGLHVDRRGDAIVISR